MPRRNSNARKPRERKRPKSPKKTARQVALQLGFSSGFEHEEEKRLQSVGISDTRYEAVTITWLDMQVRTYRPDFVLPNNIIIETKGRLLVSDRRKHLRIKEQHPDLDIRFVFYKKNSTLPIYTGSKTSYGQWCTKNGILYADGSTPAEWIAEPEKAYVPKLIKLNTKEESLVNESL